MRFYPMWPLMSDNAMSDYEGAPTSLSAVREHPARHYSKTSRQGCRRTAGRDARAPLPINHQLLSILPGGNIEPQRGALELFGLAQQSAGAQSNRRQRIFRPGYPEIQIILEALGHPAQERAATRKGYSGIIKIRGDFGFGVFDDPPYGGDYFRQDRFQRAANFSRVDLNRHGRAVGELLTDNLDLLLRLFAVLVIPSPAQLSLYVFGGALANLHGISQAEIISNCFVHRIARGGNADRTHHATGSKDRNVTGAAANIDHEVGLFIFKIQTSAQTCRQPFVDKIDATRFGIAGRVFYRAPFQRRRRSRYADYQVTAPRRIVVLHSTNQRAQKFLRDFEIVYGPSANRPVHLGVLWFASQEL